jgi:hypothetical protein
LGVAAIAAALAVPAGAGAAGWSEPVELSGAKGIDTRVVSSPGGDAVIAWAHKGDDASVGGGPVSYSTRAPGAGFAAPQPIAAGAGGLIVDIASNAHGEASVTWNGGFTGGHQATPYGTAFRAPGGPFGDAATVPFGEGVGVLPGPGVSAMDGAGNTTWTWVDPETKRSRAVTRSRDGSFGPVREWPYGVSGAIASDGAGNLVLAWMGKAEGEEGNRIFVASAPPGGAPGPARAISEQFGNLDLLAHPKLRLVANDRGDFVVAWSAVPLADPQPPGSLRSDQTLHVSVRPRGGEFGPPEAAAPHPGRMTAIHEWDLAVSARGDAIASWTDRGQVAAAYRPAGGTIERAVRLDPTDDGHDHGMPSVGLDGRGDALILYEERVAQHHHQIRAVHRPAGGRYGPISIVDDAPHLYTPDVAADADGDAVAAWTRQSRWTHDSKEDGVRAAVFDPSMPALAAVAVRPSGDTPSLAFKASSATRVTARFDRREGKRWVRVGKASVKARRGRNAIRPGGKLARRLRQPGRYRAALSAPVGGGLETQAKRIEFRVR